MQRILAEVTEHMEEQYTSHKYLEKLQAENEAVALQERDRKVNSSILTVVILQLIPFPVSLRVSTTLKLHGVKLGLKTIALGTFSRL